MSQIDIRGMCPLLEVFDMPTSFRFYTEVLGFEVVEKSDPGDRFDWVWLHWNDAHLMLNTQYEERNRPAEPDETRRIGHGDTGLFFNTPDVLAVYEHLRSSGVAVEAPVARDYGWTQVYSGDPDGYGLCFQWPTSDLADESE